jgi:mannan endo-1,4-beta-mannosidase
MKLLSILSLGAAVAALPAAVELSPRASISKTDGLKFNIDGVTKCKSGNH